MDQLPLWIAALFILTLIIAFVLFYLANGKPKKLMLGIFAIAFVQSALAYNGFYQVLDGMPPRFLFILFPTILIFIYAFQSEQIEWMKQNRNSKLSTFFHAIRIPVEIVLLYLFLNGAIPELMTFEGRNFDILAGITALIVGFLFLKDKISRQGMIVWNFIGLGLVLFIMLNAILSVETPIQLFAFDQPNRALLFFPFVLLGAVLVPMVVYMHVTDIIVFKSEQKELSKITNVRVDSKHILNH